MSKIKEVTIRIKGAEDIYSVKYVNGLGKIRTLNYTDSTVPRTVQNFIATCKNAKMLFTDCWVYNNEI